MNLPNRRARPLTPATKRLVPTGGLAYSLPPFRTMKAAAPLLALLLGFAAAGFLAPARAETPYQSSADFAKYAAKMRESALLNIGPRVVVPTNARPSGPVSSYPWKENIVTTTFWVGESASSRNPVHNHSSSWDLNWGANFGGFDTPDASQRKNHIPIGFTPRQNPFYIALPYNDVTRGNTKPEARTVIPWFKTAFTREGQSVCRDRWVEIKRGNKRCFAQWSDCGPFRTDHWAYVFGSERPKPNLNSGAGLDVSPAVRDFLGMQPTDVTSWRFIEFRDIPKGPWSLYGDNNHFVQARQGTASRLVSAEAPARPRSTEEAPRVLTR